MRLNLLFALSLCGFGSNIAMRLADPLVPQIAADFSVAIPTVAMLATAYALPYSLFQPVLGPVGDSYGKGLLIRASLICLSVGLLVSAFAPNFPTLMTARALSGIAAGGIIPAAIAMIGDRMPMEGRQVAIARMLSMIFIAQIVGATGAGALSPIVGWRGVFVIAAGMTMLVAIVTFGTFSPRPDAVRQPLSLARARAGYASVFSHPLAIPLFVLVFLEGLAGFATHPFVAAILAEREGVGAFEAGLVIGAFGLGALLYSLVAGRIVRGLGPSRMMLFGGSTAGLSLAAFAVSPSWMIDVGLFGIFGFGFFMMHNPMQAIATELSPTARGSAVALFALAIFLGQALGPIAFGFGSAFFGTVPMILAEAAGLVAVALLARRYLSPRE